MQGLPPVVTAGKSLATIGGSVAAVENYGGIKDLHLARCYAKIDNALVQSQERSYRFLHPVSPGWGMCGLANGEPPPPPPG